jgi:hypothetical protein
LAVVRSMLKRINDPPISESENWLQELIKAHSQNDAPMS